MRPIGFSSLLRASRLCGYGLIVLTAGCFTPKEPLAESSASGTEASAASEVSAEEATPRETLNQKTQQVLQLQEALAAGGELADSEISSTNPLLQSADAYRTSVAKLGGMAVEQAIQIRNAQSINEPQPLTHDQFMTEIIKPERPDGIMLAMLPYYQEYAWDEAAQKLVVVNFPARVQEREKQR